jgi:hypothetical protein
MLLNAQTLLESPEYFPLKFEGEDLVFVKMSRSSYQQSIFTLPNRIVTDGNETWTIPFSTIVSIVEQSELDLPSPAVIFQIAHCGSTLLSRALDRPNFSLVIRESFALRQYCASPVPAEQYAVNARKRGLKALWTLLSRKYAASENVLLKSNVPVNYALNEINEYSPKLKGVLLYCSFTEYLVATLKSEQRRAWAKHVVREMAQKIQHLDSFLTLAVESLDAAQAAAILWLSQIQYYQLAVQQNPSLLTLNSKDLFEHPENTLFACSEHLSLNIDKADSKRISNSDLFSRHAKTPGLSYTQAQRIEDLGQLQVRYKSEIAQTLDWCELSGFDTHSDFTNHCLI